MVKIKKINSYQIPDSRGGKTIECAITLENNTNIRASIPGSTSPSPHEAPSMSLDDAIKAIQSTIAPLFINRYVDLDLADKELSSLINSGIVGKQATLPISIAIARAENFKKKLFNTGPKQFLFYMISGGTHGKNGLSFHEILLMPMITDLSRSLRIGLKLQEKIIKILESYGYATDKTNVPCWHDVRPGKPLPNEQVALDIAIQAIESSGLEPGRDVEIGLDVTALQFYDTDSGLYKIQNKLLSTEDLISFYEELALRYPITFIEDGLRPDDWTGWRALTDRLSKTVQIIGDDLFASNSELIKTGIKKSAATGTIIRAGQTATVSDLLKSIKICHENNFDIITSPRSRETNDTFIGELTATCSPRQFKTIVCHCDNHMKKNNLIINQNS